MALERSIHETLASGPGGRVIEAAAVRRLIERSGLDGVEALMVAAIPVARELARPITSGYRVGAVGLEAETGDILLGGNLEFPPTPPWTTIHGEGFVAVRAAMRGSRLAAIAIDEARPCAHCRQTLTEFHGSADLLVIDPAGERRRLAELYPWPFEPGDLGRSGIGAPETAARGAEVTVPGLPADGPAGVRSALESALARSHAPYSGSPSAVVVRLTGAEPAGGELVAGASIESVAWNPVISPLQAVIVEVFARARDPRDIEAAWLAAAPGAAFDFEPSTRELLAVVAPEAALSVVEAVSTPRR